MADKKEAGLETANKEEIAAQNASRVNDTAEEEVSNAGPVIVGDLEEQAEKQEARDKAERERGKAPQQDPSETSQNAVSSQAEAGFVAADADIDDSKKPVVADPDGDGFDRNAHGDFLADLARKYQVEKSHFDSVTAAIGNTPARPILERLETVRAPLTNRGLDLRLQARYPLAGADSVIDIYRKKVLTKGMTMEKAIAMALLAKANPEMAGGVKLKGSKEAQAMLAVAAEMVGLDIIGKKPAENLINQFRPQFETAWRSMLADANVKPEPEARADPKNEEAGDKKGKDAEAAVPGVTPGKDDAGNKDTARPNRLNELLSSFDKPIGALAGKYASITDEQREQAAAIQADLITLHNKGVTDFFPLNTVEKIQEKKAELDVTEQDASSARALVNSGQGVPDGVPKFGDILVRYNFIDRNTKNRLLEAQAAARTLQIVNRIESGNAAEATPDDVLKAANDRMFNAIGKFPDPATLTEAQANNLAAAIYEKKIGAKLEDRPQVDGFKARALRSIINVGHELQEKAPEARKALEEISVSYKDAKIADPDYLPVQPLAPGVEPEKVPETAEILADLDKPIGLIAAKYASLGEEQREQAAAIQADLLALKRKEFDGEFRSLKTPQNIEEAKNKLGVTAEDVQAAREVVDSKAGIDSGVPKFGDILVSYGFIDRDTKNALLTAQAAARTLTSIERLEKGEPVLSVAEATEKYKATGKFADPSPLSGAQAVTLAAAIYEGKVKEGIEDKPKVEGFRKSALASLEQAASALGSHPVAALALRKLVADIQTSLPGPQPAKDSDPQVARAKDLIRRAMIVQGHEPSAQDVENAWNRFPAEEKEKFLANLDKQEEYTAAMEKDVNASFDDLSPELKDMISQFAASEQNKEKLSPQQLWDGMPKPVKASLASLAWNVAQAKKAAENEKSAPDQTASKGADNSAGNEDRKNAGAPETETGDVTDKEPRRGSSLTENFNRINVLQTETPQAVLDILQQGGVGNETYRKVLEAVVKDHKAGERFITSQLDTDPDHSKKARAEVIRKALIEHGVAKPVTSTSIKVVATREGEIEVPAAGDQPEEKTAEDTTPPPKAELSAETRQILKDAGIAVSFYEAAKPKLLEYAGNHPEHIVTFSNVKHALLESGKFEDTNAKKSGAKNPAVIRAAQEFLHAMASEGIVEPLGDKPKKSSPYRLVQQPQPPSQPA